MLISLMSLLNFARSSFSRPAATPTTSIFCTGTRERNLSL